MREHKDNFVGPSEANFSSNKTFRRTYETENGIHIKINIDAREHGFRRIHDTQLSQTCRL